MNKSPASPNTIFVFPDYMASGLWDCNRKHIPASEFEGVLSKTTLIALKYWVWNWERHDDFGNGGCLMSESQYAEWWQEGAEICNQMERDACYRFEFTYDVACGHSGASS